MQPPRAVVVGTGHSATGYTARVLRKAGLMAAHEGYYNPIGPVHGLDVDASWLATAYLPLEDTIVWHQVREPLRVITSLTYTADWHGAYSRFRKSMMREFTDDPLLNSMISYVDSNLKAEEHATRRWRVEDMDAKLVRELCRELGTKVSRSDAKAALHQVSTTVNRHWAGDPLTWGDLPDTPIKDELIEMSERYGYA